MNTSQHLSTAKWLVHLLDNRFSILGYKFGLDPLIGMIPVAGDIIAFVPSLYILHVATLYQLPEHKKRRMVFNIVMDTIIGAIPLIGFFADFAIKANQKNLEILERHVREQEEKII